MYLNQTKLRRHVLEPLTTSCARYPLQYIRHTWSVVNLDDPKVNTRYSGIFPGNFLVLALERKFT